MMRHARHRHLAALLRLLACAGYEFTFPGHSGFGNQVQQILPALFLAAATNRVVVLPPFLAFSERSDRSVSLNIERAPGGLVSRSCQHAGRGPVKRTHDPRKSGLIRQSEAQLARVCRCVEHGECRQLVNVSSRHQYELNITQNVGPPGALERWSTVYDLDGFPHRERGCADGPLCDTVHATLLNRRAPAATTFCHSNASLAGETSPTCGEQLRMVRDMHVAGNASSPPLCLGPLNSWWLVRVLEKCSLGWPAATALLHFGLPLRSALRRWERRHLPPACDVCVYVRIGDNTNARRAYALFEAEVRLHQHLPPYGRCTSPLASYGRCAKRWGRTPRQRRRSTLTVITTRLHESG